MLMLAPMLAPIVAMDASQEIVVKSAEYAACSVSSANVLGSCEVGQKIGWLSVLCVRCMCCAVGAYSNIDTHSGVRHAATLTAASRANTKHTHT